MHEAENSLTLVTEAGERDVESLECLLQSAYRYAHSLCHDPAEAEDLVQDACASILGVDGPWERPYLFATVRNQFIDRYRRKRRLLFVPLEGARGAGCDPIDRIEDGGREMPDVIASESLHRALGRLRPEEREAMYLAVVEEFTSQEIADMTGRPRGTILCLLHRSRKKLRKMLGD